VITVVNTITNSGCGRTLTAIRTWKATDVCSNSAQLQSNRDSPWTLRTRITCVGPKTIECGTAWTFDAPSARIFAIPAPVITVVNTITNSGCGRR